MAQNARVLPDVRMAGVIARYWGWYTADNRWYHYRARRGFKLFRSDRETRTRRLSRPRRGATC